MSPQSPHLNTVSPRLSIPPGSPRTCLFCANTTTSPTSIQPTQRTPGVSSLHKLIDPNSRWGWVLRHPIATTFSLVVFIVITLIVVMVLTLNADVQELYAQIPYNVTGIAITGHNYMLDLDRRTLTIEWEISGCGDHRLSTYQSSKQFGKSETCGPFDRAVDIYLNDATKPAFSYDPAHLPVSPTKGALYMHTILNFGMEHRMDIYPGMIWLPATKDRHYFDQQLNAPFDDYLVNAFAFVIDKATNQSVHITRFTTADPLNNFVTFARDTETVNEFSYETENGTVTIQAESRALEVVVHRSILAQAFTMCMLLVNWALTIGSVYITLVMLAKRERMSEVVLALPITVVLTIPAIRALFIGSPPFGILLDIAGFFFQIILVALCSLALIYVVVNPSGSPSRVLRKWTHNP